MREKFTSREKTGGDEILSPRTFFAPSLKTFSFFFEMKSRKKSPHETVNCSMICLMYKLRAIFIFHVHVCDTGNRIMPEINSFLRADGFQDFSLLRVFVQLMREKGGKGNILLLL